MRRYLNLPFTPVEQKENKWIYKTEKYSKFWTTFLEKKNTYAKNEMS